MDIRYKCGSATADSMSKEIFAKIARKLLTESLDVQKDETVTVETWNNGLPLARTVILESKRLGATPLLFLEDEEAFIEASKTLPKENVGRIGRHEYNLLAGTDAYVFIPGPPIGSYSPRLKTEERAAATAYNMSWYEAAAKAKLRGVRLSYGYVGEDLAKLLGKSAKTIIDHQLNSMLVDYQALKERSQQISKHLNDNVDASLSVKDEKLDFQLKGDITIEDGIVDERNIMDGNNLCYIPPGLVAKEVDPQSASGSINISSYLGSVGKLDNLSLEFKEGQLVSWKSRSSKAKLDVVMRLIPEKDRRMTSIMIGLNPAVRYGYGIDRFVEGAMTIGVAGSRFAGVIERGNLKIGERLFVDKGKLT